jgi:hypothetical protein
MYKSKFDLLFEEIIKTTISVDTFDYKFEQTDNDDLICTFETLNDEDKLIKVTATVKQTGEILFDINDGKIGKEITEKEFMLKFYKDYEKFKEAYKKYQDEQINDINSDNEKEKSDLTNTQIPQIKSFKNKLNDLVVKNEGKVIKSGNVSFLFRFTDDDIKNLIQVDFDLFNDKPKEDESTEYNVIGFVKLLNENSVPVKFILQDKNNELDDKVLSHQEFKERFPQYYKEFIHALELFEQANNH